MFQRGLVAFCLFGFLHSAVSSQCELTTKYTTSCTAEPTTGKFPDDLQVVKLEIEHSLAQIQRSLDDVSERLLEKLRRAINDLRAAENNLQQQQSAYENVIRSCSDINEDGKFNLTSGVEVLCSNGWTVFQRRWNDDVDFRNKTWEDYKNGFGDLNGQFWWGLENLHEMTKNGGCRLNIEMWFPMLDPTYCYADYRTFSVGNASELYRLQVSGYSGSAGDSLTPASDATRNVDGMYFSTPDSDNDKWESGNCAAMYGAFWHNSCTYARLNADYDPISSAGNTISWYKRTNSWGGIDTTDLRVRCD